MRGLDDAMSARGHRGDGVVVLAGLLFAALLLATTASGAAAASEEPLSYNRDVRPIIAETCFKCHGPDKANRKAKFRLDDRDSALAKKVFVPGKPAESELVKRITTADQDDVMPPPEAVHQLNDAQKRILERWIAEGATYEPHWSYIAPKQVPPPAVADPAWAGNPIDAFIAARLAAEKVAPASEADRPTLLRRLSLDLIGLPPSPEEIAAFVADAAPDACIKQVRRLLASPHYGERMAVPWLDEVHFADTVGYHGDQNQNDFPYRDWVIDAFNRNLPFDRFTTAQLAGDLMPDADVGTRIASGFNRLNMVTREGGAQPKEYLAKYTASRVRTLGGVWLGSTLGCCECHDHKYDPWKTRDFYRFGAFFADLKQWGVYSDYGYTKNPELAGFNNDFPFPPELPVASPYLKAREQKLLAERDQLARDAGRDAGAALAAWEKEVAAFIGLHPDGWQALPAHAAADGKSGYQAAADGVVLVTAKSGADLTVRLAPPPGRLVTIRLDLLTAADGHATLEAKPAAFRVDLRLSYHPAGSTKGQELRLALGDATTKKLEYRSGAEVLGLQGGWFLTPEMAKGKPSAAWVLEHPLLIATGDVLEVTLPKNEVAALRLSASPLVPPQLSQPAYAAEWLARLAAGGDTPLAHAQHLAATAFDAAAFARLKALEHEIASCRDGIAMTTVAEARAPYAIRVLPRGNWQDESGEEVQPGAPGFLAQIPDEAKRRLTRLDLAAWLTAADNPLTARVFVNRVWAQLMGVGLCASVDDFGLQGEWPSHPELLDWLAVDFRTNGWDVKRLITLIVSSRTYRLSAVARPELAERDPQNRWRARQSPRRLDAEFVRDNALAISGLLNLDIGGPSIFPYQPQGYYANLQFPDRDYIADGDDRQYRRGVYIHWQRAFLHPMLANFDAPSREECTVYRSQSNSPQQALTLLNDPTFVEAARVWAASLVAAGGPDAGLLEHALRTALGRAATPDEASSLLAFLATQRALYSAHPDQALALLTVGHAPPPPEGRAAEVAAWTMVCRAILNLHETITRY
jgi:hypothetical protein